MREALEAVKRWRERGGQDALATVVATRRSAPWPLGSKLAVSEDDDVERTQLLERVHGPAGLDLGAATPAETAISIFAEILAIRAGREGTPLRARGGAVHAEPASL